MADIVIPKDEENRLKEHIAGRTDAEARRMERYLSMPDLSRTPGSPLHDIVERVRNVPRLKELDEITIPEIISTDILFDLFDFPANHPARSRSDTYYADDSHVLRTHDTVFWYYHLNHPEIKERIARNESLGAVCYGKVYRKDEIDNRHMNVFHQFGAWYLQPESKGVLTLDDMKQVLSEVIEGVFGKVEYKFTPETFPYTDPSTEVEVNINDRWIEIVGSGIPKKTVLQKLSGLEGYTGWAFGFGLERLAIISMELPDIRLLWSTDPRVQKQLTLGKKYEEVSRYPAVIRDISFIVGSDFVPNNYFDTVRETVGDSLVEEVTLIDTYANEEKFGAGKVSYAYRITYRSLERTLTNDEVDALHKQLEAATVKLYQATIR